MFDQHARLEDRHWWFVGRRAVLGALLAAVEPPRTGALVVDVGAGTGANLASLAREYRVLGVEPAEAARRHASARFPELVLWQGEAVEAIRARQGERVVVLLMDVAEHVMDDFKLVSELVSALPIGGHLIVTVPADPRLWSAHDVAFGHYRRYTTDRLAATWAGLPVEVRLFADFNTRLAPLVRCIRAAGRVVSRWREGGSDLTIPAPGLNRLLARILAGEAPGLVRRIDRRADPPSGRGVSLVAILRRLPGEAAVRGRPPGIAADRSYRR